MTSAKRFAVRGVNTVPVDVVQKSGLTKKVNNVKITKRRSAKNPDRDVMIKFNSVKGPFSLLFTIVEK